LGVGCGQVAQLWRLRADDLLRFISSKIVRVVQVFDPAHFIPAKERVTAMTAHPAPYELAWQETHCGKTLSDAIEAVRTGLGTSYDLASSLVWAEITAQRPRVP
jgi:hypothetical protein